MTRQPGRKKPKREVVETKTPDLDLEHLAEVLDENRLETNADGWFTLPWRDGWNAVRLAVRLADGFVDPIADFCKSVVQASDASQETYWRCAEFIDGLHREVKSREAYSYQYAALRCIQVLSSNSSGGGEVYNYLLRQAIERDLDRPLSFFSEPILGHRCHDAIGLWPSMQNDDGDRYRRAFVIAWKRGLFHAAYAIKNISPATTTWS